MKKRIGFMLMAVVMAVCLLPATALAEGEVQYEPLEIASTSLNGNAIWGVTETWSSSITLDNSAAFYAQLSSRNSGTGGLPVNGSLTTTDGTPYQLATGGDEATAYDGNDCIWLHSSSTSVTMNLQTIGVYQNIYVLATAGGPGKPNYAKFNVTLNYTDGTTGSTTYKLYDWYDLTDVDGVEKYYPVMRRETSGSYTGTTGTSNGPILQSATIEADSQRLLKSITFNLQGLNETTSLNNIYCGIFAVTGATPAGAPAAPVATAATKTEGDASGAFTANWETVSDATSYRLDVAADRKFTNILSDYNNKEISGKDTLKFDVVSTSNVTLDANTTYYYRVRAVNDKGQSLSSNRISTDLPNWLKAALNSDDYDDVTYDAETNTVTFENNVTLEAPIVLPAEDTTVIDLGGNTVTAPEGQPAIKGSGTDVELSVTGGGLVGNGTDGSGNGAPVIDFSGATGSSAISVTGSTVAGSDGSDAENGGNGGAGIAANGNTRIEVGAGSTVAGGSGGSATTGNGGNGGAGISGGSVSVSSGGTVTGGDGGDALSGGTGGSGGAGISDGSGTTSSGTVTGGDGGNGAGGGGSGGSAGTGGGTNGSDGSTCIHSWVYTVSGNKIMAYCEAQGVSDCDYRGEEKAVTLTLTADNADYSGSAYSGASVTNAIAAVTKAAAGSIFYQGTGTTVYESPATPPTVCGTYQASVTVGGQTATAAFVITPSVTMGDYTYAATPSTPNVMTGSAENTGVTVYYSTYSDVGTDHRQEWKDITGTTLNVGTYYMAAYMKTDDNGTEAAGKVVTFKVEPNKHTTPAAPTVDGFTVTINEADRVKKLEYSLDGTNWVSVPALNSSGNFDLTGLTESTAYTVYLREKASADGNYLASDPVTTSFTTPTKYSVAYNANYGTGTVPASVTQNGGSTVTVASGDRLQRTGYTFSGWNTAANGSGTAYVEGNPISNGATLYAQWTANTYTVKFDANGGTGTMDDQNFTYDAAAAALPANTFTKDGCHFAGWATSASGPVSYVDQQSVKNLASGDSVTLYAVWVENVYPVGGTITSDSTESVTVRLMRGSTQIGALNVTMSGDSSYNFVSVPAGTYNIVATQGDKTVTTMIIVTNAGVSRDITIPSGDTNSVLDVVGEDTRPVVVGGLDAEAETKAEESKTVTVTMTVEKQEEQQLPDTASQAEQQTQEAIAEIKAEAPGKTLEFMDIEVEKKVQESGQPDITEKLAVTNTVMEIVIPYDMAGKNNITVYRHHDGVAEAFAENTTKADGTFYLDRENNLIYVYAQKFSTYAIGYTVPSSGGGYTPTTYPVTVPDETPDGGTVSVSPKNAQKGDPVTVTVDPDDGHVLDKLIVTDKDGNEIPVTDQGDGTYTFTMPAGKVSISASFRAVSAWGDCSRDGTCPIWLFPDADTAAWYHDAVHYCLENGLIVGYADGTFRPNADTGRAMLVTMLWRLEGCPVVNYAMDFEDVNSGAWYASAVRWAASKGVVEGYGNGMFGPEDPITREQLAAILYRYAQFKGYDVSVGENTNILSYNDALTISDWAFPAMQWACGSGVIEGKGNGILAPVGKATRAEAATMLMRFCEDAAN